MTTPTLTLGGLYPLDGNGDSTPFAVPAHDLVTHAVVLGMTGSGKTGLVTVLVEEALRARVPVVLLDVKGDLADLALTFPAASAQDYLPWLDADALRDEGTTAEARAELLASSHRAGLAPWALDEPAVRAFVEGVSLRVLTPGSTAGEPLHLLSALERRSPLWDSAPEQARSALASALSLLLRLVGREADPARSREHVLLSVLAERHLRAGEGCELGVLVRELETPPLEMVGALAVDDFVSPRERHALAAALNALLASPTLASWRAGSSLDVGAWMSPREGRTPVTIVSVAHLCDEERAMVLGVLLDAMLAWVHTQPGSSRLRGLLVLDEVYGFLPPHPANPPTKKPLVALLKQGRAFGVGVVLATQNPMDLDYRALSNAGLWFLGRLQTDADRERVVEGLATAEKGAGTHASELGATLKKLGPRWFVARNVHAGEELVLVYPREAMAWLRGPLTQSELARVAHEAQGRAAGRGG